MRRTKIVATIGPASRDPEVLVQMIDAGMDVARLNFSHGSADEHAETAQRVRDAANRAGRSVAILQDLPGPKLRIGKLHDGIAELKPGDEVTFVCGAHDEEGDARRMYITWAGLADTVEPDEIMYLADGAVRLRITTTRPGDGEIDAVVEVGGSVASRQGLNIPGETAALPSVPEEDFRHLETGERIGVDLVALSFVRRAEDIEAMRKHTRLPLIAKIEKPQAVQRAEEIVRAADCVMVARGDLGIEMRIEEVPIVQKQIISLAGALARPVITATQMLDSMVASSRPTRAEVTDVANAILDGTDAVMLSQESAVGQYPVGAVAMLASIAERTELTAPYREWNERRVRRDRRDPAYTLAYTACRAAHELGLAALVCPTLSGRSARLISAHRPTVPIYALSPGRETVRRCGLMWGVQAESIAAHRDHGGADRRERARASSSSAGSSPASASGSRRACRPGSRGRRASCRSRPSERDHAAGGHHDQHDDRRDRLGRAEVVERAAERRVGERARCRAERRRRREHAQGDVGQPRAVVDEVVRHAGQDPGVQDRQESAPRDRVAHRPHPRAGELLRRLAPDRARRSGTRRRRRGRRPTGSAGTRARCRTAGRSPPPAAVRGRRPRSARPRSPRTRSGPTRRRRRPSRGRARRTGRPPRRPERTRRPRPPRARPAAAMPPAQVP